MPLVRGEVMREGMKGEGNDGGFEWDVLVSRILRFEVWRFKVSRAFKYNMAGSVVEFSFDVT